MKSEIMKYSYIIFSLLFMLSCSETEQKPEDVNMENTVVENTDIEVTTTQFQSSNMQLGTIQEHAFYDYITASGILDVPPENKAEVSAYYGGYVKSLNLLPGEWVNAGQVLFTIENPEFIETQQAYLEAKSEVAYLKEDYERQKILVKEEIVSQKKYQRSQADYNLVKNKLDALRRRLQMMKINPNNIRGNNIKSTIAITSPISGYIQEVTATNGQFLSPQDVAIVITNNKEMHLELQVFEKDLSHIKEGMPVEFTLQENPDQVYIAKVHLISKAINPDTRTMNVHCDIDLPEDVKLSSGMYADARIKTKAEPHLALPKDAILELDSDKVILIKKSQNVGKYTFEEKVIETGVEDDNYVEIKTTLPQDTEVLVKGGFQLVQ
ncbi:MAG: efflux RND transporter periplasmic adaptor subunit [Weeksellaceae bacterium]